MTARLDGIKDHPNLLRAFSILLETQPLATLELLGDGELRAELETLAVNLGIRERVKFRGMVTDVYAEMAHWDLFAYSTTDREGLGNALIEAMMLGLPCVVTEAGPMRELVGDPPAVLLTAPDDPAAFASAIRNLIRSLPSRTALARAAKMRALSEYGCEKFARRYLELLDV
jgi:glycosyltransferase involved in cell wall biosynthesis